MKLYILLAFTLIGLTSYSQKLSEAKPSNDSTFGYTSQNPIKLKAGNYNKSMDFSISYLKQLKTEDGQHLVLIRRGSVEDPNQSQKKPLLVNRYTGMPLNGKLGILDKYQFVTEQTKDTLTLFVDIYNKGELLIPKGLKLGDK